MQPDGNNKYTFPGLSASDNGKKIKFRISGSALFNSAPDQFTDLILNPVIEYSHDNVLFLKASNGQMGSLKDIIRNDPRFSTFTRLKQMMTNMFMISNNANALMIVATNSYIIKTLFNNFDNNTNYAGVRRNGGTERLNNIQQLNNYTNLNITKLEYAIVEDTDILPTDYKLNFD